MEGNYINPKVYDPFIKGRWYKIFAESNGTAFITTSDITGCSISSTALKLPAGWQVLDYVCDMNVEEPSAAASHQKKITYNTDGTISISIPSATAYDYGDIYVFAYAK